MTAISCYPGLRAGLVPLFVSSDQRHGPSNHVIPHRAGNKELCLSGVIGKLILRNVKSHFIFAERLRLWRSLCARGIRGSTCNCIREDKHLQCRDLGGERAQLYHKVNIEMFVLRGENIPLLLREVASQASDPHPRCFALP